MREYKGRLKGKASVIGAETSSLRSDGALPAEELSWGDSQKLRAVRLEEHAKSNETKCDHCGKVTSRDNAVEMYVGASNIKVVCFDCLRSKECSLSLTPQGMRIVLTDRHDEDVTIRSTNDLYPSSYRP